jgi:hypothetical protein
MANAASDSLNTFVVEVFFIMKTMKLFSVNTKLQDGDRSLFFSPRQQLNQLQS